MAVCLWCLFQPTQIGVVIPNKKSLRPNMNVDILCFCKGSAYLMASITSSPKVLELGIQSLILRIWDPILPKKCRWLTCALCFGDRSPLYGMGSATCPCQLGKDSLGLIGCRRHSGSLALFCSSCFFPPQQLKALGSQPR